MFLEIGILKAQSGIRRRIVDFKSLLILGLCLYKKFIECIILHHLTGKPEMLKFFSSETFQSIPKPISPEHCLKTLMVSSTTNVMSLITDFIDSINF